MELLRIARCLRDLLASAFRQPASCTECLVKPFEDRRPKYEGSVVSELR
jgi:hypothetical protein